MQEMAFTFTFVMMHISVKRRQKDAQLSVLIGSQMARKTMRLVPMVEAAHLRGVECVVLAKFRTRG